MHLQMTYVEIEFCLLPDVFQHYHWLQQSLETGNLNQVFD